MIEILDNAILKKNRNKGYRAMSRMYIMCSNMYRRGHMSLKDQATRYISNRLVLTIKRFSASRNSFFTNTS